MTTIIPLYFFCYVGLLIHLQLFGDIA